MTIKDIYAAIDKVGCMSVATHTDDGLQSRIVSLCGFDDEGLYFLTMNIKPFYRQMKKNPSVTLCGMFPTSRKDSKNAVGQPYFPPGFTLRISGEVHEVDATAIQQKAAAGSVAHQYAHEEQERYPAMRLFCIYKGHGEIYDFDYEKEHREHKLIRERFAFGGAAIVPWGARIDAERCIACGECAEACTFNAILADKKTYRCQPQYCDECGSCALVCPQAAIAFAQ